MSSSSSSPSPPPPQHETLHDRCLRHVRDVLKEVNTVSYIVDVLHELGRPFQLEDIRCVSSRPLLSSSSSGASSSSSATSVVPTAEAGYCWGDTVAAHRGQILLHEDQLLTKVDIERSLRHELIHAFDDARGIIEPTNCFHHACSEVRAARLSGDCFLGSELQRGNVDLLTSGRVCVRRRAALAVENNAMCRSFGERAVDVVFARCYNDYEPFVAPLYSMGSFPVADGGGPIIAPK